MHVFITLMHSIYLFTENPLSPQTGRLFSDMSIELLTQLLYEIGNVHSELTNYHNLVNKAWCNLHFYLITLLCS